MLTRRGGRAVTQEGTGVDLEQQGPTASTGVRKLIGPFGATACLQSVSTQSDICLRGARNQRYLQL